MLPAETTIPAKVTVLAKRVASPVEHANERILTVELGGHYWDLYVDENEFDDAMAEALGRVTDRSLGLEAESGD